MKTISLLTLLLLFSAVVCADTFTNKKTGKTFTGFATARKLGDKTVVISKENGKVSIIPSYYNISYDAKGRKNTFATIKITDGPQYEMEIEAIEKEIKTATNRGYLFILIELDAKGGEPYIESKLSSAITNNWQCPTYCYINGEGAHDYTALIPLACDKIFISKDATFGSKTSLTSNEDEQDIGIKDLHITIGNNVGEKFTSILRATASSLAQNNNRPTILAQAMFDNQLKVVEVKTKDGSKFINSTNKKKNDELIKTVSKNGEFLQLTAQDAVDAAMADKIIDSKKELLAHLNADSAEEVVLDDHIEARETIDSVVSEVRAKAKKIHMLEKKLKTLSDKRKKRATIQSLLRRYRKIKKIAIGYPELGIPSTNIEFIITYYNSQLASLKHSRR